MSQEEKKDKEKKTGNFARGAARLMGYGLVLMFLMVWIFVLGVLTGRGDMNRLVQRLGLYKTDLATRLGIAPENKVAQAIPVTTPEEAPKSLAETEKKPGQEPRVAQAIPAVPVPPGMAADPSVSKTPAETAKKAGTSGTNEAKRPKGLTPHKLEQDENLAAKLNFQNSLDTPTKKQAKMVAKKEPAVPVVKKEPAVPVAKKEPAVRTASIAPLHPQTPAETTPAAEKKKSACAYQVKVGSYRTAEEAEKAMAELKKKGIKASVQPGKEKTGNAFVIKTGRYPTKSEAEKVTQKLKEAKLNGQIQELKP